MFLIGDDNIQADRAFLFRCGAPRLRHKSEIGNKLAASPEIARDLDPASTLDARSSRSRLHDQAAQPPYGDAAAFRRCGRWKDFAKLLSEAPRPLTLRMRSSFAAALSSASEQTPISW